MMNFRNMYKFRSQKAKEWIGSGGEISNILKFYSNAFECNINYHNFTKFERNLFNKWMLQINIHLY